MEAFDDDKKDDGVATTDGAEVGDGVAAGDGGTVSDGTFDPGRTAEYRRGDVLGDPRPAERGEPEREPTFVSLENVDQTVDEVIGWLKCDINKFDGKFLEVDEDDDALFGLIDDQFTGTCKEIIAGIISGRQKLAFTKGNYLRKDDCVLLINEMFRTLLFHRHHVRSDGSSYFYSHLIGSVKISIAQNFVGLRGVLGVLKHDDFEDVSGFKEEDVLDFDLYKDHLEIYDEKVMSDLKSVVMIMAKGLKKVRATDVDEAEKEFGVKFEDEHEATFFRLLHMMVVEGEARIFLAKLFDRTHNMETIDGHKSLQKRQEIAMETREVYIRLARILGIRWVTRALVDDCVKVLNPHDLYGSFYDFTRVRVDRFLPFKDEVDSLIKGLSSHVKRVEFVPDELHDYTRGSKEPLGDIKFEDFKIDALNPMQEIVVVVDGPNSMVPLRNGLSAVFDFSEQEVVDHSRPPIKATAAPLLTSRGDITGELPKPDCDVKEVEGDSSFVPTGITIKGYSRRFGQPVVIRINDNVSEERAKRGIFAHNKRVALPEDVSRVVKRLIKEKLDGTILNILTEAKKEFLRPKTYVKTPHGEICPLPQGATYLDAAFAFDPRLLIGMRGVTASHSSTSGRHGGSIDFFDEIPVYTDSEAPVLVFDSSLVGLEGESDGNILSKVPVDRGWLQFCYTRDAWDEVLKYLQNPFAYLGIKTSEQDVNGRVEYMGRKYVERLSRIFGVSRRGIGSDEYRAVGSGEIDPFSKLVGDIRPRRSWIAAVDVANKPGVVSREISPAFTAANLSFRPVGGKRKKLSEGSDIFEFFVEKGVGAGSGDIDNESFFKVLLKLSYKRDVKLIF